MIDLMRWVTVAMGGALLAFVPTILVLYFRKVGWRNFPTSLRTMKDLPTHITLAAFFASLLVLGAVIERILNFGDPASWRVWFYFFTFAIGIPAMFYLYRYEQRTRR